jgi:acyl-coenzyme A synthetase/AMP-(fatty) acid ligase
MTGLAAPEEVLGTLDPHAPVLLEHGRDVPLGTLLAQAAALGVRLAGASACINLCERRPEFLTTWMAALLAGCPTLLPSSRAPEAVAAVQAMHPGAVVLQDEDLVAVRTPPGRRAPAPKLPAPTTLRVPGDRLLMIGFTSGSTGTPSAHRKSWRSVQGNTLHNAAAIRAALPAAQGNAVATIVGTVPSQHMYGMELTVLLPLLAGFRLHAARPLLPQDIADVLAETPEPRVLVSTPAHLRAIVGAGIALPRVAVTVSATAPLDAALAREVEALTGGVLVEMFGSTETCILGARHTAREVDWHRYEGVVFRPDDRGTLVEAPWFDAAQRLQDLVELPAPGRFRLVGRSSDMVDVAGKRASLAELTARVLAIPGVRDAVVFQPDARPGLVRRLAVLVVAPGLDAAAVRMALRPAIDPAFMPRPLLLLDALPRTAAGKLPRAALLAALAAHAGRAAGE